ncbi:hypothetical protein BDV98DRAFT_596375 [Pterulicium gracile]|uniref:Uncharacterized protein n=1 Tax=Pterulicium gracile TaxID=1884261 RepID=A0A5C3Q6Y8_9AGAR|nr:hypothetical protein BDV98DRAFT_596375 [Pterula gracilis]
MDSPVFSHTDLSTPDEKYPEDQIVSAAPLSMWGIPPKPPAAPTPWGFGASESSASANVSSKAAKPATAAVRSAWGSMSKPTTAAPSKAAWTETKPGAAASSPWGAMAAKPAAAPPSKPASIAPPSCVTSRPASLPVNRGRIPPSKLPKKDAAADIRVDALSLQKLGEDVEKNSSAAVGLRATTPPPSFAVEDTTAVVCNALSAEVQGLTEEEDVNSSFFARLAKHSTIPLGGNSVSSTRSHPELDFASRAPPSAALPIVSDAPPKPPSQLSTNAQKKRLKWEKARLRSAASEAELGTTSSTIDSPPPSAPVVARSPPAVTPAPSDGEVPRPPSSPLPALTVDVARQGDVWQSVQSTLATLTKEVALLRAQHESTNEKLSGLRTAYDSNQATNSTLEAEVTELRKMMVPRSELEEMVVPSLELDTAEAELGELKQIVRAQAAEMTRMGGEMARMVEEMTRMANACKARGNRETIEDWESGVGVGSDFSDTESALEVDYKPVEVEFKRSGRE